MSTKYVCNRCNKEFTVKDYLLTTKHWNTRLSIIKNVIPKKPWELS